MRSSRSAPLHVSLRRSCNALPMIKTRQTKTKKTRAIKAPGSGRNRASAEERLAELKRRVAEISDLDAAGSLLDWDPATYMPEGGAGARARQVAMLRRLSHERSVDPALGKLIDALEPYGHALAS